MNANLIVPDLNVTADLDAEKKLVRKVSRAIKGAPLVSALNAVGRCMHGLQRELERAARAADAAGKADAPAVSVSRDE